MKTSALALALCVTSSVQAFLPVNHGSASRTALFGGFDGNEPVVYDKTGMETAADLVPLAKELNPAVKFFDPLNLAEQEFWGDSNEATVAFLRQSEIKHGRIAMFAFVGYCAQANGVHWPWPMTMAGDAFPTDLTPPQQWDAIPEAAKWQIFVVIAFLEFWDESTGTHYMRGRRPGQFPALSGPDSPLPHPVPFNLFDPFGLSKNKSEEKKARGLKIEINNGRLAMLGIFGFLAESKVEGSVPALKGLIPLYDGNYMAPFETNFHTMLQQTVGGM
uniref:Plastid light harvesting protein n=1 Tax=Octactis speculum TaxID=3111310 RepID=A0A7S2BI22_9STRA|mmetsp:Transcript_23555/g.32150  ORF Transcript_23555/g.32150 Transcript_23555/m.32150 type:complete len:275 (+) Transcript_23555:66-890(+)|eukprot:CAMPEP_0185777250 /NCGR_PEP_ID=MMETSP1174-20130828/88781_1 /TAXON_ID=35687 /ORGANISM="Dictyocha speculum, Strain CCMP1381" /LENGTH=274 /DNA_ID=CAMNT_0028465553 /DNA_START=50 /DNA_END=874 /DNA_ORIENTATION=-